MLYAYVYIYGFTAVLYLKYHTDIIRKHYTALCKAIPSNYERSINILLEMDVLPDEGIEFLYSCSADHNRKEAIIDIVIVAFANRENLLSFCNVVEVLIENPSMKHVTDEIRHGKNEYMIEP